LLDFQLFRFKVYPSRQRDLFAQEKTPPEILNEALYSISPVEFRLGITWRVGNVEQVDTNGHYFRIGRTSRATHERYEKGSFIDEKIDDSPYTHGFLDTRLEVSAIAKKTRLSPNTLGIAKQLAKLLNGSEAAKQYRAMIEVSPISDPEDFIQHLRHAYAITKFSVTFSRPNAFDVNEDFILPLQKTVESTDALGGKAELSGNHLDAEKLEEITRSIATSGDDAAASVKESATTPATRIKLHGNSVSVQKEEAEVLEDKRSFFDTIRDKYRALRERAG
jgi:hypothetical protein